jgi:SHS2 domain-containing protein
MKPYEIIDYPADIGLRIFGHNLEDLFCNAGVALFDTLTDIKTVLCRQKRKFTLSRDTTEELLVEWLNTLLYVFETERMLFSGFMVRITGHGNISAVAEGEPFSSTRHYIKQEIKAVTYHDLKISGSEGLWQARVVMDV